MSDEERKAALIADLYGIEFDVNLFVRAALKLTLEETGELVRALKRADKASKPNREQRILHAVMTRPPVEEDAR